MVAKLAKEPFSAPGIEYTGAVGSAYMNATNNFTMNSMDFHLMQTWKDKGIPLFIPVQVLKELGERLRVKPKKIRGINYVAEEVEARFGEWREGQVGR